MKYIKLFEQEEPTYSMYDIITMTPGMASEVLFDEIKKPNPDMELIKNILDHSWIDVNLQDKEGMSALYRASRFVKTEIVRMLLEHPEIDVNLQDRWGNSALMWASRWGHTEIVRGLLRRPEILVNLQDEEGWSALIWASEWGNTEIANLIKAHPNFNP